MCVWYLYWVVISEKIVIEANCWSVCTKKALSIKLWCFLSDVGIPSEPDGWHFVFWVNVTVKVSWSIFNKHVLMFTQIFQQMIQHDYLSFQNIISCRWTPVNPAPVDVLGYSLQTWQSRGGCWSSNPRCCIYNIGYIIIQIIYITYIFDIT